MVALYERDGGLLWKHYDIYHDKNESRRARNLVLSFIAFVERASTTWFKKLDRP